MSEELRPIELHMLNDWKGVMRLHYQEWIKMGSPGRLEQIEYDGQRYMVGSLSRADRDHYEMVLRKI